MSFVLAGAGKPVPAGRLHCSTLRCSTLPERSLRVFLSCCSAHANATSLPSCPRQHHCPHQLFKSLQFPPNLGAWPMPSPPIKPARVRNGRKRMRLRSCSKRQGRSCLLQPPKTASTHANTHWQRTSRKQAIHQLPTVSKACCHTYCTTPGAWR